MLDSHRAATKFLLKPVVPLNGGDWEIAPKRHQQIVLKVYDLLLDQHDDFLGMFEILTATFDGSPVAPMLTISGEIDACHFGHGRKDIKFSASVRTRVGHVDDAENVDSVARRICNEFVQGAKQRMRTLGTETKNTLEDMAALAK
ncbi:MAG: hypothetical protein AAB790_02185 [Patescibacteria group bacterium]